MKSKRLADMSQLERALIKMVWEDVKDFPNYNEWRKYERGFSFEGKDYRYKCKFKVEDGFLRLINTSLEFEQVIVELLH